MNVLKNQKGSILSAAIIVIVLLSFSLTTVTSYTANVAKRTTTVVEQKSDTVLGQTLINRAIAEFKTFINDDLTSFADLHNTFEDQNLIDTLFTKYSVVVTIQESHLNNNNDTVARIYRFSYTKPTGETIYKDLYVTLGSSDNPAEIISIDETIDDQITTILNTSETLQSFCTEEGENVNACLDAFETSLDGNGANRSDMVGDVYFDDDLTFHFTPVKGDFKMNGFSLLVNGNLDLSNIEDLIGPGLIFVTGNLTIDQRFSFYQTDVLIMVKGTVTITFDHHKSELGGNNFAIIAYDTTDNVHVPDEGDTYFQSVNGAPVFMYIGDDPFSTYGDLETLFEQFQIRVGNQVDFVTNESAFQTE